MPKCPRAPKGYPTIVAPWPGAYLDIFLER